MAGIATRGVVGSRTTGAATVVRESPPTARSDRSLDRFVIAAAAGVIVAAVPFLWLLWDLWSGLHPARVAYNSDFYDAQARAIMHGHLWVSKRVLDVEAFRHGNHYYTYFGILPSLLRIPLLLVAPNLYGQLTAPFIGLAWLLSALFSSLLIWRVRAMTRGNAPLGRVEAASYGALMATICGGSAFLLLASTPWVYHEDLAWSVALTVGTLFALLGVIERPSKGRVIASGVLVLAASLNRVTTGWACVLAAGLVGLWFLTKRSGTEDRRWAYPMFSIAFVSLAAGCAVNLLKFGTPFGISLVNEAFTAVNAHQREFLAHTGGRGYSLSFVPTTLLAYFQPFGLHLQSVFPFVTLPVAPSSVVGGVFINRIYRIASAPASMPLLFLLTCWAVVATYKRRARRELRPLRYLLIAAVFPIGPILLWGSVIQRFEADLLPLFILGAAIGLVELARLVEARRPRLRAPLVGAVFVLGAFSILANFGIAVSPTSQWTTAQAAGYVRTQKAISDVTGHPLASYVVTGTTLPYWAPAGELFAADNCSALYLSTGESFSTVPQSQLQHATWLTVEAGPGIDHTLLATFHDLGRSSVGARSPLLTYGPYTIFVEKAGQNEVRFGVTSPSDTSLGTQVKIKENKQYPLHVVTDPYLDVAQVTLGQGTVFDGVLSSRGQATPGVSQLPEAGASGFVTVADHTTSPPRMSLCLSLASRRASR